MKSIPQTPKLKPNMRSEASTMLQWLNQSRWYKNVIDTVLWCLLCITLSLKYTICLKHESKLVAQACIHTYMHNIAKIHTHTHIHHTQTYIHTYIHNRNVRNTCHVKQVEFGTHWLITLLGHLRKKRKTQNAKRKNAKRKNAERTKKRRRRSRQRRRRRRRQRQRQRQRHRERALRR